MTSLPKSRPPIMAAWPTAFSSGTSISDPIDGRQSNTYDRRQASPSGRPERFLIQPAAGAVDVRKRVIGQPDQGALYGN